MESGTCPINDSPMRGAEDGRTAVSENMDPLAENQVEDDSIPESGPRRTTKDNAPGVTRDDNEPRGRLIRDPIRVAGPRRSSWREHVLARVADFEAQLQSLMDGATSLSSSLRAIAGGAAAHLGAAKHAAEKRGGPGMRGPELSLSELGPTCTWQMWNCSG